MLILLCVQIVQINNNESNWKQKKKQVPNVDKQKTCELANIVKIFN